MRMLILLALFVASPVAAGPGSDHDDPGTEVVKGPEMLANETWSYTFTEPGTFEYHCHPHPWMQATIEVLPADGAPQNHTVDIVEPADFEQWDFDPEVLTIRAGDTVTWVNGGDVMHKVAETTGDHADHIAGAGAGVDEGDHSHEGGSSKAFLWIGGGLAFGLLVASWAKKQSP